MRTACLLLVMALAAHAAPPPNVGFLDPRLPGVASRRNAAALALAAARGPVTRLKALAAGGWQDSDGKARAPEEFDVIWYHEGDDPAAAAVPDAALEDLHTYLERGGVLLLSGAAGRLVNDLGIEPVTVRVLGVSADPFVTAVVPTPTHRDHPVFAGLDASRPIFLTSAGCDALADFYGTSGPSGDLLGDGNAGLGERPLVEYAVGRGRVLFLGWRLADFTTAGDPYLPNLQRLVGNALGYLASRNTNHACLLTPPGGGRYQRLDGVPMLRADQPFDARAAAGMFHGAVVLKAGGDGFEVEAGRLSELPVAGDAVRPGPVLGLTLTESRAPVSEFVAARRAEQEAADRREREAIAGLRVIRATAWFTKAPIKPTHIPRVDTSVLLGRSPFMAPGDGKGDITPVYEPVEDGGFHIVGSSRKLNRPIAHGQNRVWTGDAPIFRMDTSTGNGAYSADKVYPLFPRADAQAGSVYPCLGTLRLGVPGADGAVRWLDDLPGTETTFRPGYTLYRIHGGPSAWTADVTVAPAMNGHGMVCSVAFDRDVPLVWRFGGIWWSPSEPNANKVRLDGGAAMVTEPNLPNGVALVACDVDGTLRATQASFGEQAEYSPRQAARVYHVVATWGVTTNDAALARKLANRLDTANAAPWAEARDRMKRLWTDCYVTPALEPERRLRDLLRDPVGELRRTQAWWDRRRAEFQIRTPEPRLDALMNWQRAITEYHRQGPGLVLGGQYWIMYSHISTGWYGKEWAGDHQAMDECLRLYAAMQRQDGFIRWVSPSLFAFDAENNTSYWVDQVWRHYAWTGDRTFLRDLWPIVRRAVAWQRKTNDPDGDGLFQDWYEYWNCDSNGKGPKAAAPSAMAWAMLDRAARMGEALGDTKAAREYRDLAERTRRAVMRQLWREDEGRLGSIGRDGFWRGHPQTWEEYLAINAGLLGGDRGRRAMGWLADHYGFEPAPGVQLLACSDWWPLRWSTQWVPTGDTLLAALAGMRCGDVDRWWPFVRTVVGSAFRSEFPGVNMGISNAGAGGGDREDVDSVDPHLHLAVRGLFGIEPAIHRGRIDICPAFPSGWRTASIHTPDVTYQYSRTRDRAVFRIHTPKPLVKRVQAFPGGPLAVTRRETDSVVVLRVPNWPAPTSPAKPRPSAQGPHTILAEQQPPTNADTGGPLAEGEKPRQVLFDLRQLYNATSEQMTGTGFLYDYDGGVRIPGVWTGNPQPIAGWWGNPALGRSAAPRVLATTQGVKFLTAGLTTGSTGKPAANLLALTDWPPYPWPAAATVQVGMRCERLWLLLQCYVHPMKNYVVNGEIILHYAGGKSQVVQLIPPFNLDCYFQHFSRQGVPVAMGKLGASSFVDASRSFAHADSLQLACDPGRELESVEVRATCTEGVIGVAGMTALAAR